MDKCNNPKHDELKMSCRHWYEKAKEYKSQLAESQAEVERLKKQAKRLGPALTSQVELVCKFDKENKQLREALEESVKLQSHYANLLNMHDSGERFRFKDATEWLNRLEALNPAKGDDDAVSEV